MAITINGTGTITGISAGGLPDNCITAADLATTLDLSSATVTLPSGTGGKILQIVSSGNYTTNDSTAANNGSLADMGLTVSITPSNANTTIIAIMQLATYHSTAGHNGIARIKRTGPSTVYSGKVQDFYHPTGGGVCGNIVVVFEDTPLSTSQCTYTAQLGRTDGNSGTIQLNKDYSGNVNGVSNILLLEFGT